MPNRWVSPTGTTDPAGGSELNPWTYQKAMDPNGNGSAFYSPGDQIFMQGGTYTLPYIEIFNFEPQYPFKGGNGTSSSPIIIKPKPGSENAVVITDSQTPNSFFSVIPVTGISTFNIRNYIWWEGIRFRRGMSFVKPSGTFGVGGPTGCRIRYCEFDGQDYPPLHSSALGGQMVNAIHMVGANNCVAEFNYIHNWFVGEHDNQANILTYHCKDCIFENNYITNNDGSVPLFEKVGGTGCIWRYNYCKAPTGWQGFKGSLAIPGPTDSPNPFSYTVEHNILQARIHNHADGDPPYLRSGCRFSDNLLLLGSDQYAFWRWQGPSNQPAYINLDRNEVIYNNVVESSVSTIRAYEQTDEERASNLFSYYNHNIYSRPTSYRFKSTLYSTKSDFTSATGFEGNSENSVALSTVYDGSWNLKSPYSTRGRFGTGVGPRLANNTSAVPTLLDTTRYGAAAYNGGSPPPPTNNPPVASFTLETDGRDVDVTSTSTDSDGTIADPAGYEWDWGDGSAVATGSTSQHTYADPITYTITHTVTDDDGAEDSAEEEVNFGIGGAGVKICTIRQLSPASSGTLDFQAGGFGTPKAARIICTLAESDGVARDGAALCIGFMDGTRQVCMSVRDSHHTTTSATITGRVQSNDSVIRILAHDAVNETYDLIATGAVIDGGVRLTFNTTNIRVLVSVTLFGGVGVSAHANWKALSGTDTGVPVTGVGFEPDIVEFTSIGGGSFPAVGNQFLMTYGGAWWNGSSVVEACYELVSIHNVASSEARGIIRNNRSGSGGFLNWTFQASSFNSDGFTLTARDGGGPSGRQVAFLALNFGGAQTWLGNLTLPNTTGTNSVTLPGFEPGYLMRCLTAITAVNTQFSDTTAGVMSLSNSDRAGQFTNAIAIQDAATASNTESLSDDRSLVVNDHSGAALYRGTFVGFDADGWDESITTATATSRLGWGWAVESAAAVSVVVPRLTQVYRSRRSRCF